MSIKPKISWLAWPINIYSVTQYLLQVITQNEAQIFTGSFRMERFY